MPWKYRCPACPVLTEQVTALPISALACSSMFVLITSAVMAKGRPIASCTASRRNTSMFGPSGEVISSRRSAWLMVTAPLTAFPRQGRMRA